MRLVASFLLTVALCNFASADTKLPVSQDATVSESLTREAQAALDRGLDWLIAHQDELGSWSNPEFPALTGLPLWALVQGGSKNEDAINKAVGYIMSCVHKDGSIFREASEERKGGGLANYNTAICMVALHLRGDDNLLSVVQMAREFVAKGQHAGDDVYNGGMGYDPETGRPYADLSNSYVAYEAMRLTEQVEDLRKEVGDKTDLDWDAAEKFVSRIQNLPEHNDQPWATDAPSEKGGFAYTPEKSMAGEFTDEDGVVRFRSYGSMTYAGLLSFIYAKVDKDDPRVTSAVEWAANHWSLDENPGMDQEGLYYFYNVLAKGLAAYDQDQITTEDGKTINWREEIIRKLIDLQKIDPDTGHGYWVNDAGRWWEADPVLVTSYALIALQIAMQ